MYLKLCLLFTLFTLSCTTATKESTEDKPDEVLPPVLNPNKYDEIGFKCNYEGKSTPLVLEFEQLISTKNYHELKKKLYSRQPGSYVLASVICDRLEKEDFVKLNAFETKQIQKNRSKMDTVFTCSGCSSHEIMTIKEFLKVDSSLILKETNCWLDEILEKTE